MATYTVELGELVSAGVNIFDFSYNLYDNLHKPILESKIKNTFYFNEIGFETTERFKFYLRSMFENRLNVWNELYRARATEINILLNSKSTSTGTATNTGTGVNKNIYNDTPMGAVNILDLNSYATNVSQNTNDTEIITDTIAENSGLTDFEINAINEFRKGIFDVDEIILSELRILFMGVYT